MHLIDWTIVVAYLAWVLYDGVKRAKGHRRRRRLFPGVAVAPMVGRRPVGDGHPDERHHARRDDGAGLRRRHPLRAVLLRAAAGDDHPVADAGPVLPPRTRLHGVRIPGAALRRPHAGARQPAVPGVPRPRRGRDHRGAGRHPFHRARLEPAAHHPGDRRSHDRLHDARRRAGGHLGRRQADGRHHGGGDGGGGRADPRPAGRHGTRAGAARRRRDRPAAGHRLHVRPERDVHLLVRPARRACS